MYYVYMLKNPKSRFYIGQPDDLARRVEENNDPNRVRLKYTAKHGPWQLVYSESFHTRSEAMQREMFIKSRKSARWVRQYLIGRASPDVNRD